MHCAKSTIDNKYLVKLRHLGSECNKEQETPWRWTCWVKMLTWEANANLWRVRPILASYKTLMGVSIQAPNHFKRIIRWATQKQLWQSSSEAKYGNEWWDKLLGCRAKGLPHEMRDETRCEGRTQRVWGVVVCRKADVEKWVNSPMTARDVDSLLGPSQAWEHSLWQG